MSDCPKCRGEDELRPCDYCGVNRADPPLHTFLVYDERAWSTDEDDCAILSSASTLAEARQDVREMFPGSRIQRLRWTHRFNGEGEPIYEPDVWEDG